MKKKTNSTNSYDWHIIIGLFNKYGTITRCDVKNGQSFNFGFVEFQDKRDAEGDYKKYWCLY